MEGIIIYVNINVKMIFNTVSVLFYRVFFLPYHVATDSTKSCQIFLMNTVVFFVLINCATILETHIQWHKVCITKMLIATEKNVTTLKFL